MADLTFPSITPARASFNFRPNAFDVTSMSGKTISVDRTGDKYIATITMPAMKGDDAYPFHAFLMRLVDVGNRVILPVLGYSSPTAAGLSLLVDGASQSGRTLNCDGASTTTIKAGTIGSTTTYELVYVVSDAAPTAGDVALSLARPLRASPADNSAVDIYTPKGLFKCTEASRKTLATVEISPAGILQIPPFQLEEAL